jgi:hypothetical protein
MRSGSDVSLRAKMQDIVPEYCYDASVEPRGVLPKEIPVAPFEAVVYPS